MDEKKIIAILAKTTCSDMNCNECCDRYGVGECPLDSVDREELVKICFAVFDKLKCNLGELKELKEEDILALFMSVE